MRRLGLDIDQLKHLYYEEKLKPKEIAKRFNCSEGAIWNEMRRQGWEWRGVKEAHAHLDGDKNPAWKGGRYKSQGYVFIYAENGKPKKRHQREHIVIWEKTYGKLPKGWVIHHLNGIRDDNRIENLFGLPRAGHSRIELGEAYKKRIRQLERQLTEVKNGIQSLPLVLE